MTVAQVLGFKTQQRFDITALVEKVSEASRKAGPGRKVCGIFSVDNSKADGKTLDLKVSIFHPEDHPVDAHAALSQKAKSSIALTFFGLQAKKDAKGYSVESSKDFFWKEASGDRAETLKQAAATPHSLPQESRELIQSSFEHQDYTEVKGTETFASLIASMSSTAGISAIDDQSTVWQMNWAEATWPTDQELRTSDGTRIWFLTNVRDITGSVTAWCNEQTALALSQLDSKDAFLAAHKDGDALFPPLASAKLVRKPGDAQQLAGASSSIRLQLVQAMDQSLHEAPAKSTFDLLPLARACEDHACGIRPASLSKIRKSAQYALAVEEVAPNGDTVLVPCQKIVALVRSQQKSKAVRLEHGFNLITCGVQDVMGAGSGAAQPTEEFTLTTMCTVENLSQYKLDPPRGAKQHAIITITDVTAEANLVVEAVQHIPTDQVQRVTASFATWAQLAADLVLGTSDKRTLPWTDLSSPASAKKCRTLGRSPTDPP